MKHSEVLSRYVNNGQRIPEKQYNRLSPSLKKSYLRMRGISGYERWEFKLLSDDEKINYIEKNDTERLISDDKTYLYQFSKNKDYYITKVIHIKGERLYSDDIELLLLYSDNKDDIAIKIIETKNKRFFNDNEINLLLDYSQNKDLIATKIIEGGSQIPEKQYNTLSQSFQKSYKRMRGVHGYYGWEFKILSDDEKIEFVEKNGTQGLRNMQYLYQFSKNQDYYVTKIIDILGDELGDHDIAYLLEYSDNKDDIAIKIVKAKGEDGLTDNDIYELIHYSDEIAIKYIEKKGEELNNYDIDNILNSTKNKYNIAEKIIEAKGKKLDHNDINVLLFISEDDYDRDKIATKIVETEGIQLDDFSIYLLLSYSEEERNISIMSIKIIELMGEKLDQVAISYLFDYSRNKELIKKTLLQNGVDYNLINKSIKDNRINIPLIPDNYQSMLNEIRRIKEMMI